MSGDDFPRVTLGEPVAVELEPREGFELPMNLGEPVKIFGLRQLGDVYRERQRQDAKFGPDRDHPDGTLGHFRQLAKYCQDINDAAPGGGHSWLAILLEEVFETASEPDPERLREELIQVAAVAVSWVEALDRRPQR